MERSKQEHIASHGVTPSEVESVVRSARSPFPEPVGEAKYSVWGQTPEGRFLQVIFVYVSVEDVEYDEYQGLELHDRVALDDGKEAVRVIHSRDLTTSEKRALRRRL